MKKNNKWMFPVCSLLAVALLIALPRLLASGKEAASGSSASILRATAEMRDIDKTLSGTGTLTAQESDDIELPSGVEITRYLVSNGDSVVKGQPLAYVDRTTVLSAISDCQKTIEHVEADMYGVQYNKADTYMKTPGDGIITAVYAKNGDSVKDVMLEHGALLTIEIDGREWKAQAYAGTVAFVYPNVGNKVYKNEVILVFNDTDDNAAFQVLYDKHLKYEELMAELSQMYLDGTINAACDGIVSGIDRDEADRLESEYLTKTHNQADIDEAAAAAAALEELLKVPEKEEEQRPGGLPGGLSGSGFPAFPGGGSGGMPEGMELPEGFTMPQGFPGQGAGNEDGSGNADGTESGRPPAAGSGAFPGTGSEGNDEEGKEDGAFVSFFKNLWEKIKTGTLKLIYGDAYEQYVRQNSRRSGTGFQRPQGGSFPGGGQLPGTDGGFPVSGGSAGGQRAEGGPSEGSRSGTGNSGSENASQTAGEKPAVTAAPASAEATSRIITVTPLVYEGEKMDVLVAEGIANLDDEYVKGTVADTYAVNIGGDLIDTVKDETVAGKPYCDMSACPSCSAGDECLFKIGKEDSRTVYTAIYVISTASEKQSQQEMIQKQVQDAVQKAVREMMGRIPKMDTSELMKQMQTQQRTGMSMGNTSSQTTEAFTEYSLDGTTVMSITPQDELTITITIDELDILLVSLGQEAKITIDAIPGKQYSGRVTEIDTAAINSGGNSKYTATITMNSGENLLAGMNASTQITIGSSGDVIALPVAALAEEGDKTFVYTGYDEKKETLTGPVEVTTGACDGSYVEIRSGLAAGTTVRYEYNDKVELDTSSSADRFSGMFGGMGGRGSFGGMSGARRG